MKKFILLSTVLFFTGCISTTTNVKKMKDSQLTFGDEVAFLKKHTKTIVLTSGKNKVAVCPELQGKIMASSLDGDNGQTFAWVNRGLITSGENNPVINSHGGEDRMWLGPQFGQFSIYNLPGDPFDKWFTPAPFNSEAFKVISQSPTEVVMEKDMTLTNYSHFVFNVKVKRKAKILSKNEIEKNLNLILHENVKSVGFLSHNSIINSGDKPWKKETGLLSIWIIGMMKPTDETVVVFPYIQGDEKKLGEIVKDDYFGEHVPKNRLKITEKAVLFKGDARHTSKIGLSPQRAKNIFGSYDAKNNVLTIIKYSKPEGILDYVNSLMKIQKYPYRGDAVNSYNDGEAPGGKSGNIYELESSSPAAKLKPGESIRHIHQTYHFTGDKDELSKISKELLGLPLEEITGQLIK